VDVSTKVVELVPEPLHDLPPVFLRPSIDPFDARDRPRRDELEIRREARDRALIVTPVERLVGASGHLHVLLRHRPRSIAQTIVALTAKAATHSQINGRDSLCR
jgi:hypothetical protein